MNAPNVPTVMCAWPVSCPRLLLWSDKNSDGKTAPGELLLLMFSGVEPKPTKPGAFLTFTSTFEEHVCSPSISMFIADVWFPTAK